VAKGGENKDKSKVAKKIRKPNKKIMKLQKKTIRLQKRMKKPTKRLDGGPVRCFVRLVRPSAFPSPVSILIVRRSLRPLPVKT
jgi:hypothetical protein